MVQMTGILSLGFISPNLYEFKVWNSLGYSDVEAEVWFTGSNSALLRSGSDATAIYADTMNQAWSFGKVVLSRCLGDTNAAAHELARNCLTSNIFL
jgi:hypothetical protein